MENRKLKDMSMSNRVFYIFNTIFWIVIMFIVFYPLYLVCISSISDPNAVMQGRVTWKPVDISFVGYQAILKNKQIWIAYANSIFYTIAGVGLSIAVTLMAAYTLSRRVFPGKKIVNLYFVITMFFSGGLIPTFLIMRDIGLYNSRWIIILMGCVSVWNMMVARTYIETTIPDELYEAAVLDGATHFQFFNRVVLPLSKTIVAVLAVYYGVGKWNGYMTGLVYIKDKHKLPLQTVLRDILATLQVDRSSDLLTGLDASAASTLEAIRIANVSKYCVIVVSTLPIIILYVALQKYFEKGVMIGSLKG